jgi:rubredoxin
MVVRAIPVVESAPVSAGGAPLLRQEGGPGSGRHAEGGMMKGKKAPVYDKTRTQVIGWVHPTAGYHQASKLHGGKAVGFERGSQGYGWVPKESETSEAAPVASGVCHDEADAGCQCPDCAKKQEDMGVPSSLIHDETGKVPVKSFRDDIKRKVNLRKVMGKHEPPDPKDGPVYQAESSFVNPPGPIPKPFKKNTGPDEVVGDYAPNRRYKTVEAVPSSFNDDPAGMDDTSDLDLGMLDPDDNEEIPSGDDQMWTKEQVNYRYSGDKFESCGNCVHFKFPGSCDIIAGPVRPVDVCDKFEAEDDDKGAPFGWQSQQQTEDEDAHSVDTQTVPSTLVPLRDKNVVQAVVAEGGPASAWGMVTSEGGPGSGRAPAGIHVNGVQNFPGKEPHVVFTDKITKSTMMIPQSQATPENMQTKAVAKRREFYGDPTERRQAMKKTASESQAIKALANRLAESAFDVLKGKLAHKKGVTSPGGLAAYIGRKKYGKAGMAKKAAAGRRKTTEAPGEFMPVGPGKTAGDASGKMAYEPTQRNKKYKGFRDSGKSIAPEA